MAGPRVPLRQALATPGGKREYTRRVFATIADRYDLVNVLLSFNRDRAWKRRLVERARARPGEIALDLACGTGDIAFSIARAGASVVGLDVTPRMIELARLKAGCRPTAGTSSDVRCPASEVGPGLRTPDSGLPTTCNPHFLVGDMMALPFRDATFDLVTTGYGIRNVPDMRVSLREILRVLKPGGRFFSLDFNRPGNKLVRGAYLAYLAVVGAAIGWILHRDADTYRYIPETIRVHPGGTAVAALFASVGFENAAYEPVFGGFMAMHCATKGR
jgi:demethylmenaquinone methyltransferase/2-methoxy-6-polyprenyl-1,4-benzoquinol methylase